MAKDTFEFDDSKVQQNLDYFVAGLPMPDPVMSGKTYSPSQWWHESVLRWTRKICQRGKNKIERQNIDKDFIT